MPTVGCNAYYYCRIPRHPSLRAKRLLNHKMSQDVTAGYIIMDVERFRKPMQQITDFLLKKIGIKDSDNIVNLKKEVPDEQTA